jgi:hypothetical protein
MNDKVDLIYHDLEIVSDKSFLSRKVAKYRDLKNPVIVDLLVKGNAIATSSVVVRSYLLKQIDGMNDNLNMVGAEDYNTWLRIAQLTNKFTHIKKRLGFYQQHNKNISSLKDMSIPTKNAIAEFVKILSYNQMLKVQGSLSYTKGRFNYQASNFIIAKKELNFCLLNGALKLKFKALYMLFIIFIQSNVGLNNKKT